MLYNVFITFFTTPCNIFSILLFPHPHILFLLLPASLRPSPPYALTALLPLVLKPVLAPPSPTSPHQESALTHMSYICHFVIPLGYIF